MPLILNSKCKNFFVPSLLNPGLRFMAIISIKDLYRKVTLIKDMVINYNYTFKI